MLSRRWINGLGFLACAALLGYGYYLQYVQGLEPCPLCMFQRVALMVLGGVFLLAFLHGPRGWGGKVYALLLLLAAGSGAALATRHVYLQNLPPDQVPECGPDLEFLMDVFPLKDVVLTVLQGSGSCAEISWQFLGLTIPAWTLVMFIGLGLVGVVRNWVADDRTASYA